MFSLTQSAVIKTHPLNRAIRKLGTLAFSLGVLMLIPGIAMAQGQFMPDTSGFVEDMRNSWNLIALIVMFGGLAVLVIGMLFPIASYLKWAAVGAIAVGAFGETIANYAYDLSGQQRGDFDPAQVGQNP